MADDPQKTSRIPGFYKLDVGQRLREVQRFADLTDDEIAQLQGDDPDRLQQASRMIENVAGLFHLPVGFAANFRIDGVDRLVPMVIEEPSVVAASSNAAKLLRGGRGIVTEASAPLMIGQIQMMDVGDLTAGRTAIEAHAERLLRVANDGQPRLLARGGGARRIDVRPFPETEAGPMLVVHILVDVCDAMGANLVNAMAEALAPELEQLTGGNARLRILSNLADERLAKVTGRVPVEALARPQLNLSGREVAERIAQASVFAEVDPYRAATHNKGIMNGVDAFLLATGQDWRAIEAGAHAYAARDGKYGALATWRVEEEELVGRMTLPVQVGIVGGVTRVHPVVKVNLRVLAVDSASEIGQIAAAVGLAQNLAAIMALATEGIQRGHMSLHARNIAAAVGAQDEDLDRVVAEMIRRRAFTHAAAESILEETPASTDDPRLAPMTLDEIQTTRDATWPQIEALVAKVIPRDGREGSLSEMIWYQLGTGGKRLRATIPLVVYEAFGGRSEDAIPLAAALELLHNATLIHDDAESAVRTRRGHETVWVRYGLSQAINCGDGLFYGALRCLLELERPPALVQRLCKMVIDHMQEVIGAQIEAVALPSEEDPDGQERVALIRDRTGGLFALAVGGAGALAEAPASTVDDLVTIGGHLGVIFQVQDELLDMVGPPDRVRGSRLADGKVGLLTAYALTHAPEEEQQRLQTILLKSRARTEHEDIQDAIQIFRRHGALQYGADLIGEHDGVVRQLGRQMDNPRLSRLLAGIRDIILAPVLNAVEGA